MGVSAGTWGTHRTRLHDLLQRQVHPCVAHNQVPVEVFAILELDEDGVALRRVEESEGELRGSRWVSCGRAEAEAWLELMGMAGEGEAGGQR